QSIANSDYRSHPTRARRALVPVLLLLSDMISITASVFAASITNSNQLAMPCLLSGLLIIWFFQQRHYTARRNHWMEVKHILTGVATMALITGWAYLALKTQVLGEVRFW